MPIFVAFILFGAAVSVHIRFGETATNPGPRTTTLPFAPFAAAYSPAGSANGFLLTSSTRGDVGKLAFTFGTDGKLGWNFDSGFFANPWATSSTATNYGAFGIAIDGSSSQNLHVLYAHPFSSCSPSLPKGACPTAESTPGQSFILLMRRDAVTWSQSPCPSQYCAASPVLPGSTVPDSGTYVLSSAYAGSSFTMDSSFPAKITTDYSSTTPKLFFSDSFNQSFFSRAEAGCCGFNPFPSPSLPSGETSWVRDTISHNCLGSFSVGATSGCPSNWAPTSCTSASCSKPGMMPIAYAKIGGSTEALFVGFADRASVFVIKGVSTPTQVTLQGSTSTGFSDFLWVPTLEVLWLLGYQDNKVSNCTSSDSWSTAICTETDWTTSVVNTFLTDLVRASFQPAQFPTYDFVWAVSTTNSLIQYSGNYSLLSVGSAVGGETDFHPCIDPQPHRICLAKVTSQCTGVSPDCYSVDDGTSTLPQPPLTFPPNTPIVFGQADGSISRGVTIATKPVGVATSQDTIATMSNGAGPQLITIPPQPNGQLLYYFSRDQLDGWGNTICFGTCNVATTSSSTSVTTSSTVSAPCGDLGQPCCGPGIGGGDKCYLVNQRNCGSGPCPNPCTCCIAGACAGLCLDRVGAPAACNVGATLHTSMAMPLTSLAIPAPAGFPAPRAPSPSQLQPPTFTSSNPTTSPGPVDSGAVDLGLF